MAEEKIFVGRKDELKQFGQVLKDPKGQAVLVVGQAGMGKSMLLERMEQMVGSRKDCGVVSYSVTSKYSVEALMERMINDAFEAAQCAEKPWDLTEKQRKQWYALLKTLVPKGRDFVELIDSLRREEKLSTWEQFENRLKLISTRIGKDGRAVFIVDPLEYIDRNCAEDWALLVRNLPAKIKFVFAQRPEDALAQYRKFRRLGNVVKIPEVGLEPLENEAVDELVDRRATELSPSISEVRDAVARYGGHPYATVGAIDLIADGTSVENLPSDPTETGIIEEQWGKICQRGEEAIRLFKAYAILEVSVPDSVVERVAEIGANERLHLLSENPYLDKLLHGEGENRYIYHLLLAKYILNQMGDGERKGYHERAAGVYREKLRKAREEKTRPDELAAERLAEHVLAAEGPVAFLDAFVNECGKALINLGMLDTAEGSFLRALGMVEKGSKWEAIVKGNLGLIYQTKGELEKAEEIHKKALEINEKIGRLEGMANQYGNLGLIYQMRGELEKAEEVFREGLKIDEKLGRLEGIATKYGNLGLIYQTKGELDKAEEMLRKSLEIEKKLGRLEGMANQYGNLGLIYRVRGELDKAEEMHKKSLEIAEGIGHQEIMANQYGNLGLIYQVRGELEEAEEMHKKSLEINEKIGRLEEMAIDYGNLGLIYRVRGELGKAEEMFLKSLEISEPGGMMGSTANQYSNLGGIYKMRGDVKKAREYWEKAVGLYKRIGMPHKVERVQGWIEDNPR